MTNPLFDRDEVLRLSRQGMENSLRFYMTLTENALKLGEIQKDTMNEASRRQIDLVNKSFEEYQKSSRTITSGFEREWRKLADQFQSQPQAAL
ncbi:MAG TPA: hypothetical protein PLU72_01675 [Candidatus Ozemobacteraceae bacterium]|nr:hypothetical protein [Candidatus Ozemobacteraceae bacterium]